jgi:hypothetical protein
MFREFRSDLNLLPPQHSELPQADAPEHNTIPHQLSQQISSEAAKAFWNQQN